MRSILDPLGGAAGELAGIDIYRRRGRKSCRNSRKMDGDRGHEKRPDNTTLFVEILTLGLEMIVK